jgi:Rha family phage regulatory protein
MTNSQLNLVETKNNQVLTNSLKVAKKFEKTHKDVLEKIRNLNQEVQRAENSAGYFCKEITYKDLKGELRPAYEFNKDFFTLLVMGFTGEKALKFKIDYINAFNQMEQALLNQAENKIEEEKEEDNNISLYYKNEFIKTNKVQNYIINDPLLGYNFFRYKIVNERPLLNIGDIVRMIDYRLLIHPQIDELYQGLDFVYDLLDNKSTKDKTLSYYLHKFRTEYMFTMNNDLFIEEKKNPLEIYLELQEQKRLGERLRSATELANELDISAQMVGRIANKLDIKDKEHGDWFIEKNKLGRDCQVFKYNQKGFNEIKQHLISR